MSAFVLCKRQHWLQLLIKIIKWFIDDQFVKQNLIEICQLSTVHTFKVKHEREITILHF